IVAVFTLALGIGANTAIFSMLDQVLLRSLPVKEADRLVLLRFTGRHSGQVNSRDDDQLCFSYPIYRDLRDRNSVFSGVVATSWAQAGVQWHDQPELVNAELVSGNYFDVLGVQPALGRLFVASDDVVANANPVVVLSFNYWQRRFGSDPKIVNQSIQVNSHPFTVIGVAQPGFHSAVMGDKPDIFAPMMMQAEVVPGSNDLENRRSFWLNIIARLKPGLSRTQAEAGINPLWHSIRADELKQIGSHSQRFIDEFLTNSHLSLLDGAKGFSPLRHDTRASLLIIMGMAGLIGLMACANVGSLLLVRAAGRIREMSVRYALGAKRKRVLQQLLAEGLLLGLAGGALGILLAPQLSAVLIRMMWGSRGYFSSTSAGELPISSHPDLRILLFNFVLAVGVSLVFSLAPALQFWRSDLTPALKQQVITTGGPLRFRRISVAIQMGLSLLLLMGAGLFVRTLQNLKSQDVGFATDHLLTFTLDPRLAGYEPAKAVDLDTRVLGTLSALPGVHSVAATSDPELAGNNTGNNITISGYVEKENEDMNIEQERVSPGYFSALGMHLLVGRDLNDQDRAGTQKVAVVNESFARHFFGEPERALGRNFGNGGGNGTKTDIAIVGVVKDARHTTMRQEILRTVFTPYLQDPDYLARHSGGTAFYVRTWQEPDNAQAAIHGAMQILDSRLVLHNFRTMQEQIDTNLTTEHVIALLATSFGVLAILMAAVGLYGVLAYSTAQRTREIGVRIALGAGRATVVRMVLMEVVWLAGAGIIVFLPLTLLLTSTLRSQLYGISSSDPWTIFFVTLLLAAVAIFSALIPARRAARVEPMVALRYE
ncbi:MAG TPA: ABC transporter permease, partial [Terriglobales bacterium]